MTDDGQRICVGRPANVDLTLGFGAFFSTERVSVHSWPHLTWAHLLVGQTTVTVLFVSAVDRALITLRPVAPAHCLFAPTVAADMLLQVVIISARLRRYTAGDDHVWTFPVAFFGRKEELAVRSTCTRTEQQRCREESASRHGVGRSVVSRG